jgi:large repetitive protein
MRSSFFLLILILLIFFGCNSKEANLSSIQGVSNTTHSYPKIITLTPPVAGNYGVASELNFSVIYDSIVAVNGNPRLVYNTESATYYAGYVSGGGTNTLNFKFTVPAGALDYNGIQLTGAIDLNGGSIYDQDDSANAALNYIIPTTTGVLINGV